MYDKSTLSTKYICCEKGLQGGWWVQTVTTVVSPLLLQQFPSKLSVYQRVDEENTLRRRKIFFVQNLEQYPPMVIKLGQERGYAVMGHSGKSPTFSNHCRTSKYTETICNELLHHHVAILDQHRQFDRDECIGRNPVLQLSYATVE
jgi:hypothetical protein